MKRLAREGLVFAAVGLAATATHAAVALIARALFEAAPLNANLAGYLCAVAISYLGNARLTFGRPALNGPRFARFLTVSLAGLIAGQAIVWGLAERLDWPFEAALAVVVVTIPALSFAAAKLWAFRDGR